MPLVLYIVVSLTRGIPFLSFFMADCSIFSLLSFCRMPVKNSSIVLPPRKSGSKIVVCSNLIYFRFS